MKYSSIIFSIVIMTPYMLFSMELEPEKALKKSQILDMLEACSTGNVEKATALLDAGLDVNTVLQGNDLFSDKEPVVSYVFHKSTFLHWATKESQTSVARLLLDRGAHKNAPDHFGYTPLVYAIYTPSPVFDLLLDEGADIATPISRMDDMRPIDVMVKCLQPDMVKKIIERGGDIIKQSINGKRFRRLGFTLIGAKLEKDETRLGLEKPEYEADETEMRALDIIELLRMHGTVHANNDRGTIFHSLAQLQNRRYITALIVPCTHKGKNEEALKRFFAFLCVNNRLDKPLPAEICYRIFSHLAVDCTFAGLVPNFVPKEERVIFRKRFLDECWPLLPTLVTSQERSDLFRTLSIRTPIGNLACNFATDVEIQKMLHPTIWAEPEQPNDLVDANNH